MPPSPDSEIDLLTGLNEQQLAAVVHDAGPLLVVAGAGSGKTRVLTHRIAHLVHHRGVSPYEILAITFTNKAADEMRERVGALVGDRLVGLTREDDGTVRVRRWGGMWVATFHSACARFLRQEAERLGYDPRFTIYDSADSTRLVGLCINELGLDPKKITARGAAAVISRAKNELVDFDTFALRARSEDGTWYDRQVADVYRLYQGRLHRASAFDFDDLLVKTVEILQLFDDALYEWRRRFRHVLVDEWQDTNRAQYELVRLLAEEHRNLCVVGDSDQCLPPGTLVRTPEGAKPIEAVAPGEEVLPDGRVTAVVPGRYRGPLWTVHVGGRVLRGTPHHIVPVRPELPPGVHPVTLEHGGRTWIVRACDTAERARLWDECLRAAYRLDTETGVKQAMDDLCLHPDYPHRPLRRRETIDGRDYALLPLSSVQPGMRMLLEHAGGLREVPVEAVEQHDYDGDVYDLEVTPPHRYIADGVLVHNSIYRFRGADIRNILDFESDFPDATRITLDRNYRSTQNILDAANAVIAHNTQRLPKHLWTDAGQGVPIVRYTGENEHDEAAFIAEEIDRLGDKHGVKPGDCAIFYRTNAQSRVIEEVLVRLGINYQIVGGTRFYERAEIKDLLAYLRAIVNPADDVSVKRVLNVPRRGIGARTEAALDLFAGREQISFLEACRRAGENPHLAGRAAGAVAGFVELYDRLAADVQDLPLRDIVELVWTRTGYLAELEAERTVEALGRVENVRELAGVAEEFSIRQPDATLPDLLESIALVSEQDELGEGSERVVLMTMHNAKGLEFPAVFIVGMEDSVFPHHRALGDLEELEEERRLCYVAMTRARERLYVTRAWQRTLFGGTNANPPSRFLREIPSELIEDRSADRGGPSRRGLARAGVRSQYTPAARDGGQDRAEDLVVGDRILHPRFGAGRILELAGRPGSEEAIIRFDEYGTKRLALAYAPLVRAT